MSHPLDMILPNSLAEEVSKITLEDRKNFEKALKPFTMVEKRNFKAVGYVPVFLREIIILSSKLGQKIEIQEKEAKQTLEKIAQDNHFGDFEQVLKEKIAPLIAKAME